MKSAFIASCLKKPIWKLIKRKQINFRIIAKKTAEKLIDGLERLMSFSQTKATKPLVFFSTLKWREIKNIIMCNGEVIISNLVIFLVPYI